MIGDHTEQTDDQKIEEIVQILKDRYRRNSLLSQSDILHRIKYKIREIMTSLISVKEGERKGKSIPLTLSYPGDIWGAVLEKVKKEGFN